MGTVLNRIAAFKTAHPGRDDLRLQVSDVEAVELAGELPTDTKLRDVGKNADGSAKPTLAEAATTLGASLSASPLDPSASHRDMEAWFAARGKARYALWDHLEGLIINGVEIVEGR